MQKLFRSTAYKIYRIRQTFAGLWLSAIRYVVYFAILFLGGYLFLSFVNSIEINNTIKIVYLSLGLLLFYASIDIFIRYGYIANKNLSLANADLEKLIDFLSEDNLELLEKANNLCQKYHCQFNLAMIVFALAYTKKGRYLLARADLLISPDLEQQSISQLSTHKFSEADIAKSIDKLLVSAKNNAVAKESKLIGFSDLIKSLYDNSLFFSHLLEELDISKNDLTIILSWIDALFKQFEKKYFWQEQGVNGGIGRDWAFGYTPMLNLYSVDISEYVAHESLIYQCKARQEIIGEMEDILAKSGKNNILLIGEPGVGKKTLVNALAQKITKDKTYKELIYKQVIELDAAKILSGLSNTSEAETRFARIFDEIIHAGNIILYINNLASLISTKAGEVGTVDAMGFLLPYLKSERIQIVAGITYDDFKNKLQANSAFESLFTKIEVKELAKEEVLPSIEQLVVYVEYEHGVIFTYQSLRHLVELTDRYIHTEPFPQKAIDLVTELGVRAEKTGAKIIEIEDVDKLVSERVKIPTGEIRQKEKDKLLNLEGFLHQRVIGQDEAITAIANALRRSRAGLATGKKPIGSFLFIGPTGVGKTETARALAESYYGSEKNIIRFDMSEFQEVKTIDRLIGGKSGSEFAPGRLTQGVKNNPYTLVLFDELEKAHPNILNLLLQILDEGRLTDASGQTIDFTNTIIIATSNAGSEKIREYVKENITGEKLGQVIVEYLLAQGIFKPEFINRFDKVVCFKPLTMEQVTEVVQLMLAKLDATLASKNIKLDITKEAVAKLAKEGYDPVFGARALRRLIQEKIEDKIAKALISETVQKGQTVVINPEDI